MLLPMLLLVPMLLVMVIISKSTSSNSPRKNEDEKNVPNAASPSLGFESFRDFFTTLNHPDSPQILLNKARQMKSSPVLSVPLPFGNQKFFLINEYNAARKVLEDPKSAKFVETMKFFIDTTGGENIITANGHRWKHVRKSTMAAFSTQNVKIMTESIDVILDRWVRETLEPAVSSGKGIDILEEMTRVTAYVIAEVAFDYKLTEEERIAFLNNLRISWNEFAVNSTNSFMRTVPYLRWLCPGMFQAKRSSKGLYQQCETMLNSYRSKVAKNPSLRQPHKLIDMMMNDSEYENEIERVRDMIAYVIAGFDTTANTLSFALFELGRHPEEQRKLRSALQKFETEEEAKACPELKHVIRETLRLRPAASIGSVRVLGNDIKIEVKSDDEKNETQNIILQSGCGVITCFFTIQRDAKVFKDPDTFMPSRWDDPSDDMNKSVLTFSLGKRNCQGQALAYAEITEILLKLCRDYEINIVDEGKATNAVLYRPVGTILSFTKA